jgi:hypothetical protein
VSIPPPAGLLTTKDPRICAAHGGPAGQAACRAAVRRGGTAFVWDYAPAHIDGFRVYGVLPPMTAGAASAPLGGASSAPPKASPTPVSTQTARLDNGTVSTLFIHEAVTVSVTECFAVAAFAGAQESSLSAPVCIYGPAQAQGASGGSP